MSAPWDCAANGTASIAVEGNEIHDLGGGGIGAGYPNVAAGYLEAAPPPEPGEYRAYRIANNYVHHCGTDYYGAVGILLFASQDSVVVHTGTSWLRRAGTIPRSIAALRGMGAITAVAAARRTRRSSEAGPGPELAKADPPGRPVAGPLTIRR